jgi:signal transduction histidine kinase
VASATAWFIADLMAGHVYSHPAAPYWNTAVRLGFFLIVSYVLSALKASIDRQEELAQFIVHDLRSPLGNVITGLQTLQEAAEKTMDATQKELVGICLTSSNYMLLLINSLLDLARLESGHIPLQLVETSTSELIESSFGQVAIWAERKQVTLTASLIPTSSRFMPIPT